MRFFDCCFSIGFTQTVPLSHLFGTYGKDYEYDYDNDYDYDYDYEYEYEYDYE